jgi:hypothetical protein
MERENLCSGSDDGERVCDDLLKVHRGEHSVGVSESLVGVSESLVGVSGSLVGASGSLVGVSESPMDEAKVVPTVQVAATRQSNGHRDRDVDCQLDCVDELHLDGGVGVVEESRSRS